MDLTDPLITFIVTCKGRLAHLKISLPRLAMQNRAEVIVVESHCPDRSADWVAENIPDVRLVRAGGEGDFNVSYCRNRGLDVARTDWVCFIDADVIVRPDFADRISERLQDGRFYTLETDMAKHGLTGTCIVRRQDAVSQDGFDEALRGWGGEARDFYLRLKHAGLSNEILSNDLVEAVIQHTDAERARYYPLKNIKLSQTISALYRAMKFEFMLADQQSIRQRKTRDTLYDLATQTVTTALSSPDRKGSVTMTFPTHGDIRFYSAGVKRQVVLEIDVAELSRHT